MSSMVKTAIIGAAAVAGSAHLAPLVAPHADFLGSHKDLILRVASGAAIAVLLSKVL